MDTPTGFLVTYACRRKGTKDNYVPREFSVTAFDETTEAVYQNWRVYYGHKWEAGGLVSIFAGREKRQIFPYPQEPKPCATTR